MPARAGIHFTDRPGDAIVGVLASPRGGGRIGGGMYDQEKPARDRSAPQDADAGHQVAPGKVTRTGKLARARAAPKL
jgi:hypothetical protein